MDGVTYYTGFSALDVFKISICYNCQGIAMWHNDKTIYPNTFHQPSAYTDMPENIKLIYDGASLISRLSRRASCALMRHALEELVKNMGYKSDLYNIIGQMYQKGLIDDAIKDSFEIRKQLA